MRFIIWMIRNQYLIVNFYFSKKQSIPEVSPIVNQLCVTCALVCTCKARRCHLAWRLRPLGLCRFAMHRSHIGLLTWGSHGISEPQTPQTPQTHRQAQQARMHRTAQTPMLRQPTLKIISTWADTISPAALFMQTGLTICYDISFGSVKRAIKNRRISSAAFYIFYNSY